MGDLVDYIRAAFALDPSASASLAPAARGALGQVSRLRVGQRSFAVKELFDTEEPAPALLAAEVEFTRRAATAGVRVAASLPAVDGRYAVPMPTAPGWLRLYEWLETDPVDLTAPDLATRLGTLLGRLHLSAPLSAREPDGAAPDSWYDVPPPAPSWSTLADVAVASDTPWARDLTARLDVITALTALATPADTATMRTCHRDLHPENVLVARRGELAVVDWDNLGPADPSRELARLLLDWFYDSDVLAESAVRETLAAYHATGAPGRLVEVGVFGLVIASRLNFLHRQIEVATDQEIEERHRDWAVREIDEALRILPAPTVFARLLAIADDVPPHV